MIRGKRKRESKTKKRKKDYIGEGNYPK